MIRRLALSLLFLIVLALPAGAVGCAGTGNCYWIGGSGNTSDPTRWATLDGGVVTGAVPTSADNCNFTALSNTTAYTVTVDAAANCKDMTWALPAVSGVPTLAGSSSTLTIAGSLTLVTGMSASFSNSIFFGPGTGSRTVTSSGVQLNCNVQFTSAATWTLLDALTLPSNKTLTVSAGTLVTGAFTHSWGSFTSTSGTRTLTLDNSTINITGTSGTVWNVQTTGSLTFSATGSTINVTGGTAATGSSMTTGGTTLNYNTINITAAGLFTFNGPTVENFSYTSTTDKRDTLNLNNPFTIAASGSLTIAGNSVVNRAFFLSNSLGLQRVVTVPSTATVTLTNVDFQDIASAGTFGTWTGTSLGDALGNSGITLDGSTTQTYAGGTNNWSTAAAWTSRVPLPQDDVVVNTTSAGTLTADMPRIGRNIDFNLFNKTFNVTLNYVSYGNVRLASGMTFTGNFQWTAQGRGAHTITSATKTFSNTLVIQSFGGSYTAQDALPISNGLSVANGTLDGQGFDVSALFFTSATTAAAIAGTSAATWSFNNTSGSIWAAGSGLTTSSLFATLKFTGNVTTTWTFAGGGKTYNNLWWSNTAAIGTLIVAGANTFADVKINRTTARGLRLPAGVTTTIGSWTDESLGTAVLTVDSSTATSAATLSKPNGIVSTDYLSLKDNAATGGAAFFAGNHSSQVSNVTGWIMAGPGGGGLLTLGFGQ